MFDLLKDMKLGRNPRVLCVDDNPSQLLIFEKCLQSSSFDYVGATDAPKALSVMEREEIDLILLDLDMPGMNGFDFLEYLEKGKPERFLPVIVVSAYSDLSSIKRSFEKGAVDFIRKPFFREELLLRVQLQIENKILKEWYRRKENELSVCVEEKVEEVRNIKDLTIFSLAKIAESRDPETGEHLERIREYVKVLAEELTKLEPYREQIDEEFIYNIYHLSILHDIGKVGIPDSILLKPGKLTPGEFEVMKTHTLIGGEALDQSAHLNLSSSFLETGRDVALYHHERWNGRGYPYGLSGADIPLSARIVAVADVYDAISFKRVYRPYAMSEDEIERVMQEEAGNLFDPQIYAVYLGVKERFASIKKVFSD